MSLFRSKHDLLFMKKINREIIEHVVDERITYYPLSKKFTERNLYGESKSKVFDPPVEIKALIRWGEQKISTTQFGQDIIYSISLYPLQETLESINLLPKEGDIIEYDSKKFEITKINRPKQMLGKEEENFYIQIDATTARSSMFETQLSGTPVDAKRTRPETQISASFYYSDVTFPYSGSV